MNSKQVSNAEAGRDYRQGRGEAYCGEILSLVDLLQLLLHDSLRQLDEPIASRKSAVHEPEEDCHDCRAHDDDVVRHRKVWCRYIEQQARRIYPMPSRSSRVD